MTCTFCGSGNRPENRFCGMCGVRLERRQMDRRVKAGNIQCAACSHVNETGHKFCGMCGAKTERRVQERRGGVASGRMLANDVPERAVAQANAQLPSPEVAGASKGSGRARVVSPAVLNQMERAEPVAVLRSHDASSSIGGPSFLGLNSESQGEGEYLLEDESSSRSGLRKLVLLAVLLAIAGLIFVQWRASYNANPKPLEPPKPAPATVPRSKNEPPQAKTQGKDEDREKKYAKSRAPAAAGNEAGEDVTTQNSETHGAAANSAGATPVRGQPKEKQISQGATRVPALPAEDAKNQDANGEGRSQSENAAEGTPRREKPSLALVKAQRYLQGRGVPQNCEQGMMYLKAATQQNDPNAAVQMAALYASGHCVQQDRAKAYQWFSSANNLEPGNQWIAKNMNHLWGQMTPQERRQFQ